MAHRPTDQRAPLGDWLLESIRVTAFPSADAEVVADNWWRDLLGEEPETQIAKRTRAVRQEQGSFRGGILNLKLEPARIDWRLSPAPLAEEPPEEFLSVGTFMECASPFVNLMERWLPMSPQVDRLALGMILLLPVVGHHEGYLTLNAYLPSLQVHPASSDLLYRINRPRLSRTGIETLWINRLMTWGVARLEVIEVTTPTRSRAVRSAPLFACRLELDINTSPSFQGPLPWERLAELVQEFYNLSLEIVQDGDQP